MEFNSGFKGLSFKAQCF